MVNGIGIIKSVSDVPTDLSSIVPKNVFLSMITVKNGTSKETVLLAMLVTFLITVSAPKETLSVKIQTQMVLVLLATLDISWTTETVSLFLNLQTLLFIILNAVPKD